ncbi:hypothetical protein BDV40DRAFT_302382 [Aspergillus tamarii]|uniref:Uncharacterized protein n=1 Tax=Aspergillus tamarii TaxID=41984 RepID=A0A5N6UQL1_ASPTM|nr:hypothetical protein BDV40DRAFT_302382 [Aspergillus tamarii]
MAVRKTRSKRPARGAQNRRGGLRPARGIAETGAGAKRTLLRHMRPTGMAYSSSCADTTRFAKIDRGTCFMLHPRTGNHRQPQASSTHEQTINDRQAIPATNPAREISPDNDETNENGRTQSGVSQPPRRQRKSRYMSLPSEVDASLNVLYRELEANASLRLEIENLREENTRCMQTIQMRDLSPMALRRELEHRRLSEQELERLQANAAQLEIANKEIQELRAKTESLEAELQISRESAKEAKALVDDWKAKLSLLINN